MAAAPSNTGGALESARGMVTGRGYEWPVRPFGTAHPVRGYFGDPRFLPRTEAFHFGVDIAASAGTRVYAVKAGVAHVAADSIAVVTDDRSRTFGYWHVAPVVGNHEVVRQHQLIGRVQRAGAHRHYADGRHLHFTEVSGGRHRDPLRPRALMPWVDTTSPTIGSVEIVRSGHRARRGSVDVIVDASDRPPRTVPPPWTDMPVVPARLSWRVTRGSTVVRGWQTPVDFRHGLPPRGRFTEIYAPGTRQNRPSRPGRYLFFLVRGWSTNALAAGVYRIEVEAADQFGNVGAAAVRCTVVAGSLNDCRRVLAAGARRVEPRS